MKIVVIGASDRIRSQTVERLRENGHEVVAACPRHAAAAPIDPGHAGRHVRAWLEAIRRVSLELWRSRQGVGMGLIAAAPMLRRGEAAADTGLLAQAEPPGGA